MLLIFGADGPGVCATAPLVMFTDDSFDDGGSLSSSSSSSRALMRRPVVVRSKLGTHHNSVIRFCFSSSQAYIHPSANCITSRGKYLDHFLGGCDWK